MGQGFQLLVWFTKPESNSISTLGVRKVFSQYPTSPFHTDHATFYRGLESASHTFPPEVPVRTSARILSVTINPLCGH